MHLRSSRSFAATALFGLTAASFAQTVFSGAGDTDTVTALNNFRAAIGGANNGNAAGSQAGGRREINWDAVKLDGTDANPNTEVLIPGKLVNIPTDRFAVRGLLLEDPYAVSGDGFVSANGSVTGQFNAFSPSNTFAMGDDNELEFSFTLPGSLSGAATRGFGAIFLDVELWGGTTMELFNGSTSLGSYDVTPTFSGGTSFLGVLFDDPAITDVKLKLGTANLFNLGSGGSVSGGAENIGQGIDLVATDDFIYAEPQPVPEPATLTVVGGSLLALIRKRRKSAKN